jgi:hypothetical protein
VRAPVHADRGPWGVWGGSFVAPRFCPRPASWTAYPGHCLSFTLEARDLFSLAGGIGRHDLPFDPNLNGNGLEFDGSDWKRGPICHTPNMHPESGPFQSDRLPQSN